MNLGISLGILAQIIFGYLAFFSLALTGITLECGLLFGALLAGYVSTVFCASLRKARKAEDTIQTV